MKEYWTGQAVLSHLTMNNDLDLGPSHTVHYTPSHAGEYLSRYIKVLQLMKELCTGQAVLSHLTLSHTVLAHRTMSHKGEICVKLH